MKEFYELEQNVRKRFDKVLSKTTLTAKQLHTISYLLENEELRTLETLVSIFESLTVHDDG